MAEAFENILAIGGKTNSLGRTNEVIAAVLADQGRLGELYTCVFNDDAWIRMRAIDAIEKVCRQHSEWLLPYIDKFQKELSASTQPSIQWHLAQIYSQVELTEGQKSKAIDWLKSLLSTTEVDWIVAANAMQTLVQFAHAEYVKPSDIIPLFQLQQNHKSKSVVKKANGFLLELTK